MKYAEWNQILIDYYFNESRENEAFLGIEKESFIDYLVDNAIFSEEYYAVLAKNPTYKKDIRTYIWNNFIQLFKKREYYSKDTLFLLLDTYLYNSRNPSLTPMVFPFIALFLMPLANNPEMKASNFYDRLTAFLKENCIIREGESIGTADMREITNPTLDLMWENLEIWAKKEGFKYHLKNGSSSHKYVGPFMAESLLNANQRDKFKVVFYEAGLTQDLTIDDERIINILNLHHRHLGFTDSEKWKTIFKNYKDVLVSEFKRQYYKWDGSTIVKTHKRNRRVNTDCGSSKKLFLCMKVERNRYSFHFKAKFNKSELGAHYVYRNEEFGNYDFYIDSYGFADNEFVIKNVSDILSRNHGFILYDISNRKNKLSFQNDEFILLEKHYQSYTSACKLTKGGKFYILINKTCHAKFESWLSDNNANKIISNHDLNGIYDLYLIPQVKTSLPEFKALDCDTKITASLEKTIVVNNINNIEHIYQNLPAYFEIHGADISNDNIRALIDYGSTRHEVKLTYNEDCGLWEFPCITNKFQLGGSFSLYCNDKEISSKRYAFSEFEQLNNSDYQEICYNKWGEYAETGHVIKGLYLSTTIGHAPTLKENMAQYGKMPVLTDYSYTFNDILLYYISSRPQISMEDFEKVINVHVHNNLIKQGFVKRYRCQTLVDNYFRLGYINYVRLNNKSIIAVNRPTLILIPSKIDRNIQESKGGELTDYKEIRTIAKNCKEKLFKAMLTGARTPDFMDKFIKCANSFTSEGKRIYLQIEPPKDPLYPHKILLWAEDERIIKQFADRYDIQFQSSLYANSLLHTLGSISEYETYIYEKYANFNETYEGFYDFSALNYSLLTNNEDDRSKLYREEVDYENDVVTYFPGTYEQKTILWKNGMQFPVDRYWGYFIGLKMNNVKAIEIDKENSNIKMPKQIRLPLLYARALTLMTGEIPELEKSKRVYELCDNPFAQSITPEAIINKLEN